ncbi:hypothetical protein RRG08_056403 [Elysia crispata]|uniref:Uncharacterized protein n=1 Tax=Elysia crispata TaxID=231223 RepID=A0AAE0YZR9_9GAST|nr:hypothetical protein RRG08_056403 [Elysia crispata]
MHLTLTEGYCTVSKSLPQEAPVVESLESSPSQSKSADHFDYSWFLQRIYTHLRPTRGGGGGRGRREDNTAQETNISCKSIGETEQESYLLPSSRIFRFL